MSIGIERRNVAAPVVFRETSATGHGILSGLAAVFGQEATIAGPGGWRERIHSGAFDAALKRRDDTRCLVNHDPNQVLGRTTAGTLRLTTTAQGLRYEVDLPATSAAHDVRELVRRGDITGSSFGFRVTADTWDSSGVRKGRLPLRTITNVQLFDVSPVAYPAYSQTSVSARTGTGESVKAAKAKLAAALAWQDPTLRSVAGREKARAAVAAARRWRG